LEPPCNYLHKHNPESFETLSQSPLRVAFLTPVPTTLIHHLTPHQRTSPNNANTSSPLQSTFLPLAKMRTTRFHTLSFSSIRSSLRRPSSASHGSIMSNKRDSYASNSSSPISTINAIMHRQPSMVDMEEERRSFGSGLEILEPRPLVYWGGLEERMGSL
jgi:hypothetical protein